MGAGGRRKLNQFKSSKFFKFKRDGTGHKEMLHYKSRSNKLIIGGGLTKTISRDTRDDNV